ncbi:type IV pilus biogenesis protein PilM [Shewanella gaetbuli]
MKNNVLEKLAFWRSPQLSNSLGVFVSSQSLWVYDAESEQQSEHIADFPVIENNWNATFSAVKQRYGATSLQLVLSHSYYQLLQADKPSVEAAEVNQALIWAVKDMVSEPVANIHLDYFESSVSPSGKVNVVISSRQNLAAMAVACDELGFEISGISIEELALTHLFAADNSARMLVTHVPDDELLLTVIKNGELLMQRRVRGFNQLHQVSQQDLGYGMADNLSLEIQRSMDYFESQLRQAPVSEIHLLVDGEHATLAELVSANFNQAVIPIVHQGVPACLAKLASEEIYGGNSD